jgi:integrase
MKKKTKHRGALAPDKYLSDGQLKKLRRYVRDMADLARQRGSNRKIVSEAIVEVLVQTGIRASELCDLNISDLPVSHGKDCIWIRDGKGNVTRTVDVSEKLKKRLERFVKLYRKGSKPDDPLFVSEYGGRMKYMSLYLRLKLIGESCGIVGLHPHILRHTFLTRLYNVERDLRFVQDVAGHASPTTTAIYTKTNNKARKRQIEALDDDEF